MTMAIVTLIPLGTPMTRAGTWFTTQKIEQAYVETQARIGTLNELVDEIITILEKDNP